MDAGNSPKDGSAGGTSPWPAVIFVFVLVAGLLLFVFLNANPPQEPPPATSQPAGVSAEKFADILIAMKPEYTTIPMADPIDGTTLEVPDYATHRSKNFFGGVATDLMSIALTPPEDGVGRPGVEVQNWEMLLVTNPATGATYHGKDILNFRGLGDYELTVDEWDLASIAPPLALRPPAEWTVEERVIMRVLTMRAFGVEDVELGFAALQGAYAANFNTWYGREVHIPSAAFYALAAACMDRELEAGLNDMATAMTAMTMGECYRLLGRPDDAARGFALVHETGALETAGSELETSIEVLAQIEEKLAAGDFGLERAANSRFAPPPVGWYIEEMLPAINGHIAQHRGDWNTLEDPAEIIDRILQVIP